MITAIQLYVHSPSGLTWPGLILVSNKTHNEDGVNCTSRLS